MSVTTIDGLYIIFSYLNYVFMIKSNINRNGQRINYTRFSFSTAYYRVILLTGIEIEFAPNTYNISLPATFRSSITVPVGIISTNTAEHITRSRAYSICIHQPCFSREEASGKI